MFKKYWLPINLFVALLLLTLILPNKSKFRYHYERGRPWLYETFVAPVDFPVIKSGAELRREREKIASSIIPYYRYRSESDLLSQLKEQLLNEVGEREELDLLYNSIREIYQQGVIDELPDSSYSSGAIALLNENNISYLSLDQVTTAQEGYLRLINSLDTLLFEDEMIVSRLFPNGKVSPNIIYDDISTQSSFKEAIAQISPTKGIVFSGQLIVSRGEIVTGEIEQLLDSYKAEYEYSIGFTGNLYLLKVGHFIILLSIVALLYFTLYYLEPKILEQVKELNFILLLLIIVALSTVAVANYSSNLLYLLPFSVTILYLSSFFKKRVVIPLYIILLLPIIFIDSNGFEIYFINLIAGVVAFYTFQYWDRGWLQFINSLFILLALSFSYTAFRLIEEGSLYGLEGGDYLLFLWNSLLVIAAYPFLFLFEKFFSLVSSSRLRDLSDATSPLLTSLAEKAPGTFHHSLQVANLAESAARAIGANALLARVGALYHDIGKMNNPSYFIENQPAGEVNIHKGLTPLESASIILGHVDEGVAIAKKMRLPEIVIDFIVTHHGKTQALYFYNQYLNEGGDAANIDKFTYNGKLPESKEQVIVMMADAVEAASRSLKSFDPADISSLVEKMVSARIAENQFENSKISIKEINQIKGVIKSKLSQSYHSRVAYPEKKEELSSESPS